jgi:hypothetical protein
MSNLTLVVTAAACEVTRERTMSNHFVLQGKMTLEN